MAVIDGQKVNAAVTNAAYMSRTTDTSTTGVVDLDNTSDPNSGAQIPNAQRAINQTLDTQGSSYADPNAKVYATNNVIADADSQKTALEKFDVQVQSNIDDIADRVVGPGLATDNAVVRYDGTTGKLIQDSGVLVDDSDNVTGVNDLTVDGDLTVNGTTTTVNTDTLDVEDANITVNKNGSDATAEGAGLNVERVGTDGSIVYEDALASKWKAGSTGSEIEIANVSSTQTFTNKTHTSPTLNGPSMNQTFGAATNTNRLSLPQETTANLDLLTDVAGLLAYNTDTDTLNLNDGVNWVEVSGTGGGGLGLNYLEKDTVDAEKTDTGDWASYADAAGTSPVDGTGGSATITFTRDTTLADRVRGDASFKLTKDAANRQGEGVSVDFSIDPIDQNKSLQIQFDVNSLDVNYSDGDLGVFIYDITNATIINPSVIDIPRQEEKLSVRWLSASNSTDYRLILHTRTTNALAYDVFFDSFRVGPTIIDEGTAIDNGVFAHYQSTSTATITTDTRIDFETQVTDNYGAVTTGASWRFTAPHKSRYNFDAKIQFADDSVSEGSGYTLKIFKNGSQVQIIDFKEMTDASAAHAESLSGAIALPLETGDQIYFTASSTTSAALIGFGISSYVTISSIDDPLVGETRAVVAMTATDDSAQVISGGLSDVTWNNEQVDTDAAFDGTTFTVPSDGYYQVHAQIECATAATADNQILDLRILVNGTAVAQGRQQVRNTSSVNNVTANWQDEFTDGDTIKIQANSSIGASSVLTSNDDANRFLITKVK